MAIYTTFFLCRPDELPDGFPGWRLPLATPVRREARNPFTGKVVVVESREPQWPEDASEDTTAEYHVVAIEGSYEDYLEARLPPFVRACPHWAAKGLTEVDLAPLLEGAGAPGEMACPLYAPPSSGAMLQQLPSGFLAALPSLDRNAVARRWAAALSTPEHTHTISGVKLSDGWTPAEALDVLEPLAALVRRAAEGQQLYLLTEA
jgi:hypothetical protein